MEYEPGPGERLSTAVVNAVSAVTGDDPSSMRPLADTVDPEALDALFEPRESESPRTGGRLCIIYYRCRVSVESGEYLAVHHLDDRPLDGPDSEQTGSDDR